MIRRVRASKRSNAHSNGANAHVPIHPTALKGELVVQRPWPAAWVDLPPEILEGGRVGYQHVLHGIVRDQIELPKVAAIDRNAVGPRAIFRATRQIIVEIEAGLHGNFLRRLMDNNESREQRADSQHCSTTEVFPRHSTTLPVFYHLSA